MAHDASTFRAYRIEAGEDGRPEGRMTTIALSDLNEGELIVRVAYSNLNYKDALAATGAGRIARRIPIVGGIDVAGVVESSEDPRFGEGEEVMVTGFGLSEDRDGGYAEYAKLKADHALALPRGLDAEEAMALGTAGLTAALSVVRMEHNGLSPDKGPVAVTGASGGVGSLAVDMLAGMGYEVTAITGKAEERGRLQRLGAGEVLARQELEMGGRPLESARWAGGWTPSGERCSAG
jgi:acrylyl-CoA reductase (NADPH)